MDTLTTCLSGMMIYKQLLGVKVCIIGDICKVVIDMFRISKQKFSVIISPLSSDRQHLSYDVCLEVRGEIIRTVLFCIVY